uniref:Uncharacterized protein n=1 Tax=Timema monikensis TaxID=170555 RepID=A0A7R9E939_9NEOP|nr:unnamed protein product [Timema monikensis]
MSQSTKTSPSRDRYQAVPQEKEPWRPRFNHPGLRKKRGVDLSHKLPDHANFKGQIIWFLGGGLTIIWFICGGLTIIWFIGGGLTFIWFIGGGLTFIWFIGGGLTIICIGGGLTFIWFIGGCVTIIWFIGGGLTIIWFIGGGYRPSHLFQGELNPLKYAVSDQFLMATQMLSVCTRTQSSIGHHRLGYANSCLAPELNLFGVDNCSQTPSLVVAVVGGFNGDRRVTLW